MINTDVDLPEVDRRTTEGSRCIIFVLPLLLEPASLVEDFIGDCLPDILAGSKRETP